MKLHSLVLSAVAAGLVVLAACDKETITSRPQLRLKSISSDFVPLGGGVQFILEFSDKEGDLSQPVGIQKISTSCDDVGYIDTVKFSFPDIPGTKNTDGILEINLNTINLKAVRCHGQDSVEQATFRFWIKDDAGQVSDTVTTQPITIIK